MQDPDNWWQVAQTPYGDWLEATSTQKAAVYAKNWQVAVAMGSTAYTNIPALLGGRGGGMLGGACVGAYAFSYGWVWQASATWINMLVRRHATPLPRATAACAPRPHMHHSCHARLTPPTAASPRAAEQLQLHLEPGVRRRHGGRRGD